MRSLTASQWNQHVKNVNNPKYVDPRYRKHVETKEFPGPYDPTGRVNEFITRMENTHETFRVLSVTPVNGIMGTTIYVTFEI